MKYNKKQKEGMKMNNNQRFMLEAIKREKQNENDINELISEIDDKEEFINELLNELKNNENEIDRLKKDNKFQRRAKYILAGTGIAVGAIVSAMLLKKYIKPTIVKELTVEVGQDNKGSMVVNQIFQRISKYGRPLGRYGNPVREIDPNTGRTLHEYATQKLAAADAGVSPNIMTKHLNGIGQDIKGRIFERMDLEWITDQDDMLDMFDY